MKTISRRLFASLVLVLALITGGAGVLYSVVMRSIYLKEQCRTLEQTYEQIQEQDIALLCQNANQRKEQAEEDELKEQGDGGLMIYENQNLRFRIRGENFELLYATSKQAKAREGTQDARQLAQLMQNYREHPRALYEAAGEAGRVILRGKCIQQGETYYIMITESTALIERSMDSVRQVLILVLVLLLIFGTVIVHNLAQGIGRPIVNAVRIAGKIAQQDFSEQMEEKTSYQELDALGNSINKMSRQIQDSIQELTAYNQMLECDNERRIKLERHRKKFIDNVSHELKTPLAIISSQAELIPMIKDEAKRQAYCDSVMEETRKMSQMLQSMLQIFAVEQGLEDIPMETVDLSETAQQAAEAFGVLFAKKQFQVEVKLQAACMINGNIENIRRAMNNFLMNAWRYAPANSQIRIKTEKVDGDAVFTVYNDGMPIDEKDREKIWDSFYQGNNSAPDFRQEGTGLGLYIVKSIVSQHGGLCSVENKEHGVEFGFRIPLSKNEKEKG